MDGAVDWEFVESNFPDELVFWYHRRNDNLTRKALCELLGEEVTPDLLDALDPVTLSGLLAWREVEVKMQQPKPQSLTAVAPPGPQNG